MVEKVELSKFVVNMQAPKTHRPMQYNDIMWENLRSMAKLALFRAYEAWQDDVDVTIVTNKNDKYVTSTQAYKKGQLVLVPLSPTVSSGVKVPKDCLEIHVMGPAGTKTKIFVSSKTVEPDLDKKPDASVFKPPFWFVRGSPDSAVVNMAPSTQKVSISASVVKPEFSDTFTISIPTLVNSVALKCGDELVQKVPDPKAPKRPSDQGDPSGSKKAKP